MPASRRVSPASSPSSVQVGGAIGGAGPAVAAANASGSATATRPHRNAAVLTATATPFSSIAHSIASAETGSAPDW